MTKSAFDIKVLKDMNAYIIKEFSDDEDILESWFLYGVPDNASENDYKIIANDWCAWLDTLTAFKECIKAKHAKLPK